jgi:hypothetical protein
VVGEMGYYCGDHQEKDKSDMGPMTVPRYVF